MMPSRPPSYTVASSSALRSSSKLGPMSTATLFAWSIRRRAASRPPRRSPRTKRARAFRYRCHSRYDRGKCASARSYTLTIRCSASRCVASESRPSSSTPADDIALSGNGRLRKFVSSTCAMYAIHDRKLSGFRRSSCSCTRSAAGMRSACVESDGIGKVKGNTPVIRSSSDAPAASGAVVAAIVVRATVCVGRENMWRLRRTMPRLSHPDRVGARRSIPVDVAEDELDGYIAEQILYEARTGKSATRGTSMYVRLLTRSRPPRTNTRFLASTMRQVDAHNQRHDARTERGRVPMRERDTLPMRRERHRRTTAPVARGSEPGREAPTAPPTYPRPAR